MTPTTASSIPVTSVAATHLRTGPMIVAVGGADPRSVLRAARQLAPSMPGGVLAVSVVEPLPVYAVAGELTLVPPNLAAEGREAIATRLTGQVQEFAGANVTWRTSVLDGDPSYALTELARSLNSPLIVMGIGRHRPVDRIMGVETSLRTIRRAPCAVLAVRMDLDAPFDNVVLATDFSAASAAAAEIVLPLLSQSAMLHVVHVWEPADGARNRVKAADAAYADELPHRFRRFIGALSMPRGVTVKSATREGQAAERILEFADAHQAKLIVAGRHGFSALKRLFVGSVTTEVLRGANCSVLVTPEPPFADTDRLRLVLTGTSDSTDPAEWEVQLAAFTCRNRGRQTVVDIEQVAIGSRVVESGYVLLGAAYVPHARHIALILGDSDHAARRVTRTIGTVDSVSVSADPMGKDLAVRIRHAGGQTVLTFPGE